MKNKKKILSLVLGATVLGSLTLSGSSVFAKEPVVRTDFGNLTKSDMIESKNITLNSPNYCEAQKAEARRVLPLYEAATTDEELQKVYDSDRTNFIECDEQPNNVSTESNTTTTTETNTVVEENKETTPKVEVVEEKTEAVPYEEVKEESPKADKKVETKKVEGKKKEAKKLPKTGSQVIGTIPVLVSSALAGIGILGTAGFIANKNRKNK